MTSAIERKYNSTINFLNKATGGNLKAEDCYIEEVDGKKFCSFKVSETSSITSEQFAELFILMNAGKYNSRERSQALTSSPFLPLIFNLGNSNNFCLDEVKKNLRDTITLYNSSRVIKTYRSEGESHSRQGDAKTEINYKTAESSIFYLDKILQNISVKKFEKVLFNSDFYIEQLPHDKPITSITIAPAKKNTNIDFDDLLSRLKNSKMNLLENAKISGRKITIPVETLIANNQMLMEYHELYDSHHQHYSEMKRLDKIAEKLDVKLPFNYENIFQVSGRGK